VLRCTAACSAEWQWCWVWRQTAFHAASVSATAASLNYCSAGWLSVRRMHLRLTTGRTDQSDRPVGPTIGPCKRPVTGVTWCRSVRLQHYVVSSVFVPWSVCCNKLLVFGTDLVMAEYGKVILWLLFEWCDFHFSEFLFNGKAWKTLINWNCILWWRFM